MYRLSRFLLTIFMPRPSNANHDNLAPVYRHSLCGVTQPYFATCLLSVSTAMLTPDIDIAILSVCLSVCLLRCGIVSNALYQTVTFPTTFSDLCVRSWRAICQRLLSFLFKFWSDLAQNLTAWSISPIAPVLIDSYISCPSDHL